MHERSGDSQVLIGGSAKTLTVLRPTILVLYTPLRWSIRVELTHRIFLGEFRTFAMLHAPSTPDFCTPGSYEETPLPQMSQLRKEGSDIHL